MARQVLPIVGAVIGAYFGNPQLGWAIGSAIGNAVDPLVIKGPTIGDIAQQTSQEGGPRPIIFALSPPIAGNVIASGEPRIVKRKKSQGKGGPKVTTESVYRTYAVGVSEGPIGGFVRVWRNGQLVYDATSADMNTVGQITIFGQTILTGTKNGAFLKNARFFTGTYDQNPSPDLETLFGVGTTPAHRGTAYMVMADEDLTDLRGAIPQWQFQVQRCGVTQPMIIALSSGGPTGTQQVMRSLDGETFELQTTPTNTNSPGSGFTWTGLAHSPELGIVCAVNSNALSVMTSEDGADWTLHEGLPATGWLAIAWSPPLGLFVAIRKNVGAAVMTSPDGINWTLRSTPSAFSAGECIVWADTPALFVAGGIHIGSTDDIMTSPDGVNWTTRTTPTGVGVYDLAAFGNIIRTCDRGSLFCLLSSDGGLTWTSEFSGINNGLSEIALNPSNGRCFCVSIFTSGESATAIGEMDPIAMPTNHWEAVCYSQAFSGFYASNTGAALPGIRVAKLADGASSVTAINTPTNCDNGGWHAIIAVDSTTSLNCSVTVAEVATELCERAGMPAGSFNVSDLTELECRGLMVLNTYPVTEALRTLSQVFFFDPAYIDGVVHFIRRGGASVATITEADMLADEDEIEQTKRGDAITIPRVLHLSYFDIAGGLAPNKQSSERAGDYRANGDQSLQSAVVMTANQAAQAVVINHKIMAEVQGGELKFRLPDSWLRLVPSNPVIVQWQGHSVRTMIERAQVLDGFQEYGLVRDRQSAYVSEVEGIPPPSPTPPPSNVIGPTIIQPLDIHILQDADDNVGLFYYVAISGVLEAWQGATVELSTDGGANYLDSASSDVAAVIGSLLDELPDHPQAYPDTVNSFRVQIHTPLAELESTDLEGLLNRQNFAIVGDEIMQFAEADEVSEGVWELSYLLRGRKGTATAQSTGSAHPIGERFVLLERGALTLVPAGLLDIGRTLTFRATSFGTLPEDATIVSMLYTGKSQTEREPGYVRARRSGVNAVIDWQGIGRLGGGAHAAHGARFDGYRVTLDDGINPAVVVDTSAQTLTQSVAALSSPITISVQQLNTLTGAGPAIEVIIT